MKISKTILSVVFVGALAMRAVACDVCAIYSASSARGEAGTGFFGGVAEQFTHFGTVQVNGVKQPDPSGQYLNSSVSQLFAGYNFNERFSLQFNAPLIYRSFQRPDGFANDRGTESGVGDVSLLASFSPVNYQKMTRTFNWRIFGGLKFPTGDSHRIYEEVLELTAPPPPPGAPDSGIHGHDLALGSGSFDGVIGTGIYARRKRAFFTVSAQYAIRTKGDFDYRYANDVTCSGGPGFYLVLDDNYTLALQAVVSGEHKGLDSFRGAPADDTGVTAVYFGPQLSVTWKEKLSAELAVDLPLSIDNTALQTVPDYRIRAGVTWHF